MVAGGRRRDWNQRGLWYFEMEDAARGSVFCRLEVLKGPLPLKCKEVGGRRRKRPKCLPCAIIKGEG